MAAVGIGLGFHVLFGALEPVWVAKAIASGFLCIAIFIFLSAERRASSIIGRLEVHKVAALRPFRIRLLAWILTGATIALIAAFWLLTKA